MKKVLLFVVFATSILYSITVKAQYCGGSSGSNICTAITTLHTEGFEPPEDSLPCIVIGQPYSQVINVHTPATVVSGGTTYTLNYIKIDTISNLPCGMCWAMGASNFQIAGNATGCLKLSGTTFDAPGEYQLHIIVDANVQFGIIPITAGNQNLSAQGLRFYVRVVLPNAPCPLVDTTINGNTASVHGSLTAPVITGNNLCPGSGNTTLTATGNNYYAYQWNNGATTSSISVSAAGTYTVTVYGECTSATGTKTISVSTVRDTITAGGPITFCQGGSVTLSVPTGSNAYYWSTGATTNSISATTSGTYTVTVTNSIGCTAVSSGVSVTVNSPVDTISASGPLAFCGGGSVTLTGPPGLTYHWSNGNTTQSINVTQAGTFNLTVTNANNCTAVSTPVTTTVGAAPNDTIAAGGPTTFCAGGSVTLSAEATGLTYHWSSGATTQSISVSQTGSYTLTVSNGGNCSAVSGTILVTVNPLPNDTITPNGPISFCDGGSVLLSAAAGSTYHWSDGSTTQSITVTSTGTYNLSVSNSNNCSASSSVNINTYALPNNIISSNGSTAFCAGGSVTLSGDVGLTYSWSNGATTQSILVTQAGPYTLTVTNSNNCSAVSAPTNVIVYALPNDTVTANGPLTLCTGGSVTLTAAAGLTYSWSSGATTRSIVVTQAGTYNVTVSNSNSCSAVSSGSTVSFNSSPSDTITPNGPTTFCAGGNVVLTVPVGQSYHWSNNATTQNITVAQTGSYSVTVTGLNNCTATSTPVVITVNANPNDTVTANGLTTFCSGGNVILSAVAGLTYSWSTGATTESITVNQTGSYVVTVSNVNNCSAVSSGTNVVVNGLPNNTVTANGPTTFCPGGSVALSAAAGLTYLWSNGLTTQSINATQAGSYTVTVTNGNHCSAVSSATVVSLNSATTISTQPVSQLTCINGQVTFNVVASGDNITYQWQKNGTNINGQTGNSYNIPSAAFSDTGRYRVVITGFCGADTSNVATLSVTGSLTFSQQPNSQSACLGSSASFTVVANGVNTAYQWQKNGQNIANATSATYTINSVSSTDTGTYSCNVTSNCGNATSNGASLTVNAPTASSLSQSICVGGHYNFYGRLLNAAGTYRDTLVNAHNCDSVVTLTLTVNPPITFGFSDSFCAGTSYSFNGVSLTSAGIYKDTLLTQGGCDSIITLTLSAKQPTASNSFATICQGTTYQFNGQALTTAGTYHATLTGANGCDSIATIHITVNQPSFSSVAATICPNSSYNFYGRNISAAGTYYDTLTNAVQCDSIVTLTLSVITTVTHSFNAAICSGDSFNFNGRILTAGGSYNDTLQTSGGCDSIVTVNLTVNPITGSYSSQSICYGTNYTFGGRSLGTSGLYYDTLSNRFGCDSIVVLNLTVDSPIRTGIHASICVGQTYPFNGQQLNTSGTYYAHFTSQAGCDSMVTLVLQVTSFVTNNISATTCAGHPYNFNGRQLSQAGTYRDTIVSQGGCDSIVILQLSVNPATSSNIHAAICAGGSYYFNGQNLTSAGSYSETLTGSNGCDSVVNLTLTINPFVTSAISAGICQNSSYDFNGQFLTVSGVYRDTLTALGGCDSIVTLTLTVNQPTASTTGASICVGSTYLFNGQHLSQTGTYFASLTGSNGCDSVATLNLQVNSFLITNESASICHGGSYNFNGTILTASGNYADTLTAQGGCDSIILLSLVENPIITHTTQAFICAGTSYTFNGQQLDTAGTYADTLTTQSGCDSISILHLSINAIIPITVNATICSGSSFPFNGQTLTTAGTYTDTLTAQGGCDSVVTLNLSISQGVSVSVSDSICTGSSYNFNGHYIALSGTYVDTLSTQSGCDSVITLSLTVAAPPAIPWNQGDTICDNNGATQITITAPSPVGGILSGNGLNGLTLTVSGSGSYPVTYTYISDTDGCSNSVTKNLVVESCVGINEVTLEDAISIYPNPANNVLIAQADVFATSHAQPIVYDVTGKVTEVAFTLQADKITFNTGALTAGMYWIKFNVNGAVVSKRFVKVD